MGTRIQPILIPKDEETASKEPCLLFSNTTSFDTLEVINQIANKSKNIDEIKDNLLNFSQYSEIAHRKEGFTLDDSPFGDYEFVVIVKEKEDSLFSVTQIEFSNYSTSKERIQEKYAFLSFDEIEKTTSHFINYNFEDDRVLSVIASMETSNIYFVESNTKIVKSEVYTVINAYEKVNQEN